MENNPEPKIKNEQIEVTIEVPKKKRTLSEKQLASLKKGREARMEKFQQANPGYVNKTKKIEDLTAKVNAMEERLKANEPKPKRAIKPREVTNQEDPLATLERKIEANEKELLKPEPIEVEKRDKPEPVKIAQSEVPAPTPALSRQDRLYELAFGRRNRFK